MDTTTLSLGLGTGQYEISLSVVIVGVHCLANSIVNNFNTILAYACPGQTRCPPPNGKNVYLFGMPELSHLSGLKEDESCTVSSRLWVSLMPKTTDQPIGMV